MDPVKRRRREPCTICHDFARNLVDIKPSLRDLLTGVSNDCPRCRIIYKSADFFKSHWTHIRQNETELVRVAVSTRVLVGGFPRFFLQWPSAEGGTLHLEIQINAEDEWAVPWDAFAIRCIPAATSDSPECISFIKSQLQLCDETHEECKNLRRRTKRKSPARLLRIDSTTGVLKLVLEDSSDQDRRYVALSHCWGKDSKYKMPKTCRENIEEHKKKGILLSSLTKTFQDAVHLTLQLELELDFIWIDSLCIVQNDLEEWIEECPKMGDYYEGAYLVVAAAHAEDGRHGLHTDRNPKIVQFQTLSGHRMRCYVEKEHHKVWRKGEEHWEAPELPLFRRAWAFQERLLARRIIHFTKEELVWECKTRIDCECGDLRDPTTSSVEFGVGHNVKTKFNEVADYSSDLDRLKFWHDITAQYSARAITYQTDRLPALSSIAGKLAIYPGFLGQYLAGIWEHTLPGGLMWESEPTNSKLVSDVSDKTHWRNRSSSIPTWSWLSIEGRVSTWGRSWKSLVITEVVSYIPASHDPYGACKEAIIKVSGVTVPVEIIDVCDEEGHTKKVVKRTGTSDCCTLIADTIPLEFSQE